MVISREQIDENDLFAAFLVLGMGIIYEEVLNRKQRERNDLADGSGLKGCEQMFAKPMGI